MMTDTSNTTIDVTPEMIEVGCGVGWDAREHAGPVTVAHVTAIYRAMRALDGRMTDTSNTTETLASINQWQRVTFPTATLAGVKRHIEEEWSEFRGAMNLADRIEEAADLIILLACYIDKASEGEGAQLHVDAKMQRNRARRWNIQTDGTGRHV